MVERIAKPMLDALDYDLDFIDWDLITPSSALDMLMEYVHFTDDEIDYTNTDFASLFAELEIAVGLDWLGIEDYQVWWAPIEDLAYQLHEIGAKNDNKFRQMYNQADLVEIMKGVVIDLYGVDTTEADYWFDQIEVEEALSIA